MMLTDQDSTFIYFSDLLKQKEQYQILSTGITELLDRLGIEYGFLPSTNTIWCRDYMPVQAGPDRFIEYIYAPDYQDDEPWKHLRTDPAAVCREIGIRTLRLPLKLEGGHVIRSPKRVLVAESVLSENPGIAKSAVRGMMEEMFEVDEVIFLPWSPGLRLFGHADGLVRFISDDHLLLNGYLRFYDPGIRDQILLLLRDQGLQVTELITDFSRENIAYSWGYVNILLTRDILLVPVFGIPEDEQALRQFHELFPSYARQGRIFPIKAREIIEEGGVLNCVSWNIMKQEDAGNEG